ncbi:MAG: peptide deformylase [Coriobacteriaceae bacterium]|nr:peptide deformylase [Olsenella sp.]MCI1289340.1 peptide deformylase [Olsenella sp.]RRF88748.1 MAG: peptide deformylase [Coriobacteriaceae bacterium]
MVLPIVTSRVLLRQPSTEASRNDAPIARDLLDTASAHADVCVGMAANMIGSSKRIIVAFSGSAWMLMYNPRIIQKSMPYQAVEGCLSLQGTHSATRYRRIKVSYLDQSFHPHTMEFRGKLAQIIQHEVDHCNGVLI